MTTAKSPVAVIGVGIIGTAITTRLLAVGHPVAVYDRNPPKVARVVEKGAVAAEGPGDASSRASYIITSLNTAAGVREVVFGEGGVVFGAKPGSMLIDMSSIDPGSTQEMAQKLREEAGMVWVDAPLSGGAPKALSGELTVMAGGTAEAVQQARAVMDSLCANYTHMGPNGAGQTTKLVNQVLCALQFQAVAEAVRLAEAGGVDASVIPAALAGGRADSSILQEYGPKMAARDESPGGLIENMLKDLEGIQQFAGAHRLPMPLTGSVAELHRLYVAAGLGKADNAAMMRLLDGLAARS